MILHRLMHASSRPAAFFDRADDATAFPAIPPFSALPDRVRASMMVETSHWSTQMPTCTWDHIHLRSADPEGTAQWFERMLGAQVIRSLQQGQPRIDLKLGGANIFIAPVAPGDAVNPPPTTPYQGLAHKFSFLRGPQGISIELLARDPRYV